MGDFKDYWKHMNMEPIKPLYTGLVWPEETPNKNKRRKKLKWGGFPDVGYWSQQIRNKKP